MKKNAQLIVRVSDEMLEKVRAVAGTDCTDVSIYVRSVIRQDLQRRETARCPACSFSPESLHDYCDFHRPEVRRKKKGKAA